jgi:hypothetical protein
MTQRYAYNKTWRLKYPAKRYRGKNAYYRRLAKDRPSKGQYWSLQHIRLIIDHRVSDRRLAQFLGRSVKSDPDEEMQN